MFLFLFCFVFSLSSSSLIKRPFSSSSISAFRMVSSAYLWLLIFLLVVLNPVCDSSSLAFHTMYSAYKLNKEDNKIQPCTLFPILDPSVFPTCILDYGYKSYFHFFSIIFVSKFVIIIILLGSMFIKLLFQLYNLVLLHRNEIMMLDNFRWNLDYMEVFQERKEGHKRIVTSQVMSLEWCQGYALGFGRKDFKNKPQKVKAGWLRETHTPQRVDPLTRWEGPCYRVLRLYRDG